LATLTGILSLSLPVLVAGALAYVVAVRPGQLRLILAFSAGYLFALSIMHLLPDALNQSGPRNVGLFIVLGFCLQLVIETFSTGIEHGHVHLHSEHCSAHLPYGIITGLLLHSFLEGLPVYEPVSAKGDHVNTQLVMGLAIHNIPITIAFVALLKEHQGKKGFNWLLLLVFSLMAPAGFLSSYLLQSAGLHNYATFSRCAYALVIGIFLHISTAIMFETGVNHRYNIRKSLAMASGIVLAYLIS
jgi:zinc and cadmium transporter